MTLKNAIFRFSVRLDPSDWIGLELFSKVGSGFDKTNLTGSAT